MDLRETAAQPEHGAARVGAGFRLGGPEIAGVPTSTTIVEGVA